AGRLRAEARGEPPARVRAHEEGDPRPAEPHVERIGAARRGLVGLAQRLELARVPPLELLQPRGEGRDAAAHDPPERVAPDARREEHDAEQAERRHRTGEPTPPPALKKPGE